MILESQISDIDSIVACHIKSFKDSLSSRLGKLFCRKMMEWFIVDERGILFHAVNDNNEVVGYISMIMMKKPGQSGSFTTISKYAFKEVVISFILKPWLVFSELIYKNRKTIYKVIKSNLFPYKHSRQHDIQHKNSADKFKPSIGIVGISVIPEFRHKGIAGELISHSMKFSKELGFDKLSLSVHPNNNNAINAYKKYGFHIVDIKDDLKMVIDL